MGVCQKMTQDDKGEGRGPEWAKKDDVIYEHPLRRDLHNPDFLLTVS